MPGEEKVILPEKYYLDYFNYLIRFVEEQYDHVLGKEDRSFVSHFRSLSEDARCLFIRFSNRKGPFFRVSKLHYQEIQDIPQAIEELLSEGFVTTMFPVESTHFHLFTRVELLQLFHQEKQALEPLKKDEMELYLTENPENLAILQEADQIVQVIKQDELEFFKMLFFGQYKRMMTEFVIRDVGHVQLEKLDDTKFKPWCKSRNEALALFEISKLKESVRTAMKVLPTIDIHPELELIDWSHFLRFDKAGRSTERLLLQFAQQLEREGFTVEALHYYQPIKKYPSRERQVRILDQLNRLEEASHLAETILSDYVNASEKVFAKDFLARPNIRINRSTSARIKEGKVITIPPPNGEKVEQCALTYLIKQGFEGAHVENFLWRSLYGLFFWEELFDQSFESFHHPLQRIPGDVFNTTFYEKRKDLLIDKLRKHSRRKQFLSKIKTTYEEKQGISNPFVHWFEDQLLLIETLVSFVKPSTIGQVLLEMSKNLKDNSTGFPDLFIWNDDTYHFYEVKSPNDHLSSQQLFWLDFFKDQGVNAEILRLEYG